MGKQADTKGMKKQVMDTPTSASSGVLGLCGFLVATIAGLVVGVEPVTLLARAILALVGCAALGWAIGRACQTLASERVDAYERDHPLPEPPESLREVLASEAEGSG